MPKSFDVVTTHGPVHVDVDDKGRDLDDETAAAEAAIIAHEHKGGVVSEVKASKASKSADSDDSGDSDN